MKTTRNRYSADLKAKVALEAIRWDLTLAELDAKNGIHHTMTATWKLQAIDGMSSAFAGASEVTRASGDAGDRQAAFQDRAFGRGTGFFRLKPSVDERGSKALDGGICARRFVDLGTMPLAVDQQVVVLLHAAIGVS